MDRIVDEKIENDVLTLMGEGIVARLSSEVHDRVTKLTN